MYPWEGAVSIEIEECKKENFEILLRIPAWASASKIKVNGEELEEEIVAGSYVSINRRWKKGDAISLDMPMEANLVEGHPRIEEVRNQVAVKRGPIVYCVESPDLPEGKSILDVYISGESQLSASYQPDLLGGVSVIQTELLLRKDQKEGMYRTLDKPSWESISTQLGPYFAWSNRGKAEMTVFMPVVWK